MKEPALLEICKSITESGTLPKIYKPILEDLKGTAIIWKVAENGNGLIACQLSPSHTDYYKHYVRMKTGSFLKRLACTLFYHICDRESIETFKDDIQKVEKIRQNLMPEQQQSN